MRSLSTADGGTAPPYSPRQLRQESVPHTDAKTAAAVRTRIMQDYAHRRADRNPKPLAFGGSSTHSCL